MSTFNRKQLLSWPRRLATPSSEAPSGAAVAVLGTLGALAVAAGIVQWRSRAAERSHPPAGKFIDVNGVRLHCLDRGEGPPVLLLHGNGTSLEDFRLSGLVDMLEQHYRVIALDRPGFGYSQPSGKLRHWPAAQADLIHAALAQLGVEKAIVVGHSWGTLVASELALRHPASVSSLVLLSGYYFPTPRVDAPLLAAPALPLAGTLLRHTLSPLLGRLLWPLAVRRVFQPARPTAGFKRFPAWMALRPSQLLSSAVESAMLVPAAFALRRRYRDLTVPVHVMAGGGDRIASTHRQSERLSGEVPGSRLSIVQGAGHMLHHVVPEQVLAAIHRAARQDSRVRDPQGRVVLAF